MIANNGLLNQTAEDTVSFVKSSEETDASAVRQMKESEHRLPIAVETEDG